jgi:pimeloyl-ACP methyl ester carboxylesterase
LEPGSNEGAPPIGSTGRTFPGARRPDRSWWVSSGGVRLATYAWGDPSAPVLLAAHGGFDFAGTFDVFAPLLVDAGWQVVSWDERGHGCSDHAVLYSFPADLRDVVAVLDDVSPDEPVAVLGHSKGGGLLMDLAHALPHRLRALVNIDGLPSRHNWPDLSDHERTRMRRGDIDGWLAHRRSIGATTRRTDTLEGLAQRRRKLNPRLPIEWLEYLVTVGGEQVDDGWRWRLDPALRPGGFGPWRPEWAMHRLPGIGAPVLGILGLQKEMMGWGTTPEDVVGLLPPGGRLEVFEDTGHFVHIEQPRRVADLVLDFLAGAA